MRIQLRIMRIILSSLSSFLNWAGKTCGSKYSEPHKKRAQLGIVGFRIEQVKRVVPVLGTTQKVCSIRNCGGGGDGTYFGNVLVVVLNKVSACGYLYFNWTNFITNEINRTQFHQWSPNQIISGWDGSYIGGMGAIWWDLEQKRSKLSKITIKHVVWTLYSSLNQYDLCG